MPVLTLELVGNSFIVLGITYIVLFIFQGYMMYLNWKQSKAKELLSELIEISKEIRGELRKR